MRCRVLLCLTLIYAMSACNGDRVGTPIGSAAKPTNDISDATHSGDGLASNRDFFFLPPMVKNPSGSTHWNAGAFNPNLRPTVEICASSAATEPLISVSPCEPLPTLAATVSLVDEHYQVNWKVPSTSTKYYRLTVMVGATRLGYADIATGANMAEVKSLASDEVIALMDGRTLPIKFRIERYALCAVPGVGPCTSASADISTTPITVSTGSPTADPSGISTSAGVTIPAQGGATATPITVTLATCADLSAVLRRRTVGSCISVTTSPVLEAPLVNRATVFICEVGFGAYGLTPASEAAIRMYRSDAAGIAVLAQAPACKPGSPGGVLASATPSVRGFFASLLNGNFRHAADEALALVTPKPLYAAMFIDQGGGGFTDSFSDFQFAVPSVLIYGPTLFTALDANRPNNEQTLATAAGFDVTVWDAATWATKTTADFAKFSAIIFPDPFVSGNCVTSTASLAAAEANRAVWSPAVNGPVVVIGTDPVFHQYNVVTASIRTQAVSLMGDAVKFAASAPTRTGVYATLNCYYNGVTGPTPVTFLSGIGAFTVVGISNLGETANILNASHPVTVNLTNAGLSNWNDSAHEAFPIMSSYPASFEALVEINRTTGGPVTYIIARP